jgi:hypothetical protein
MEANEALRDAREARRRLTEAETDREASQMGDLLADHFEALDDWLSKGGFLPADWQRDIGPALAKLRSTDLNTAPASTRSASRSTRPG